MKSKVKKNNEEKEEGKKREELQAACGKNRNHRGSVIFWSQTKADQKEHSGSPQGGVDLAFWQNRKIELWNWQVVNADRQRENPAISPHNLASGEPETSKVNLAKQGNSM